MARLGDRGDAFVGALAFAPKSIGFIPTFQRECFAQSPTINPQ
ncbi:hypothetical protein [Coleofasciculus sp. G2-EDA-02]